MDDPNPNPPLDPRILGARLQEARKARDITQESAADALGLAHPTYIAMENGEHPIQPRELIRLAELYVWSVHKLLRQPASIWDGPGFEEPILPSRCVNLAVHAYEAEEITEGELTEILRTDRQRARQIVAEVKSQREAPALERATEQGTSDVVRTALERYFSEVCGPGRSARDAILASGLVDSGEAEADLSATYKSRLHEGFGRRPSSQSKKPA